MTRRAMRYHPPFGDDSGAAMSLIRRVYVSMPSDEGLSDRQNKLKWGIVKQIEELGLLFGGCRT
jgi:hypothetical protein